MDEAEKMRRELYRSRTTMPEAAAGPAGQRPAIMLRHCYAVEMAADGGTFGTYLSTLRRNGLADVDGSRVRAGGALYLAAGARTNSSARHR